jgi:hypothetical protein
MYQDVFAPCLLDPANDILTIVHQHGIVDDIITPLAHIHASSSRASTAAAEPNSPHPLPLSRVRKSSALADTMYTKAQLNRSTTRARYQ